jgi:hypothetical protein
VSTTAPDIERELDDGMRRAWMAYTERLRDLEGDAYERAENDSWTELQTELQGLELRRASLTQTSG